MSLLELNGGHGRQASFKVLACENARSRENTASRTAGLQGSPASPHAAVMPGPTDSSISRLDIKKKKVLS